MAQVNLDNASIEVITGNDNIVVVDVSEPVYSKALNVTGYIPDVIPGGHLLIKDTVSGDIKPMPVKTNLSGYDTLPLNHSYAGFQNGSILKSKPYGAVIVKGVINPEASVYGLSPILGDVKEALPHIVFMGL